MNEYPYNKDLPVREDSASWYYWNEINETAKVSCLL